MSRATTGSCWRILAQQPHLEVQSGNYRALDDRLGFEKGGVLDEVVIVFDSEHHNASCFHLEQMDHNSWFLGIGDLKFNIKVRKDGRLETVLYDGDTGFEDKRSR